MNVNVCRSPRPHTVSISYHYSILLDWNSIERFIITGSADRVFFPPWACVGSNHTEWSCDKSLLYRKPQGTIRYFSCPASVAASDDCQFKWRATYSSCISPCVVQPVREQINYCATVLQSATCKSGVFAPYLALPAAS